MARTKSYDRQVLNAIKNINAKMLQVERTFGIGSEQYQRYVNALFAGVPKKYLNINADTGKVTVSKSKEAVKTLKLGQLRGAKKLPTAKKSLTTAKKEIARNKLRSYGYTPGEITAEEIHREAISLSDQEALEELAAKAYIKNMEDEKGKLKYTEDQRELLSSKGAKTYKELLSIVFSTSGSQTDKVEVASAFKYDGKNFKYDYRGGI